jgi:carboxylesterase type B
MRLKKEKYRPIVQTSYGPIEGKAFILNDGKEVNAFLGVPFAKPPIGNLRFKVSLELYEFS